MSNVVALVLFTFPNSRITGHEITQLDLHNMNRMDAIQLRILQKLPDIDKPKLEPKSTYFTTKHINS